jgi:hypothetical protein
MKRESCRRGDPRSSASGARGGDGITGNAPAYQTMGDMGGRCAQRERERELEREGERENPDVSLTLRGVASRQRFGARGGHRGGGEREPFRHLGVAASGALHWRGSRGGGGTDRSSSAAGQRGGGAPAAAPSNNRAGGARVGAEVENARLASLLGPRTHRGVGDLPRRRRTSGCAAGA